MDIRPLDWQSQNYRQYNGKEQGQREYIEPVTQTLRAWTAFSLCAGLESAIPWIIPGPMTATCRLTLGPIAVAIVSQMPSATPLNNRRNRESDLVMLKKGRLHTFPETTWGDTWFAFQVCSLKVEFTLKFQTIEASIGAVILVLCLKNHSFIHGYCQFYKCNWPRDTRWNRDVQLFNCLTLTCRILLLSESLALSAAGNSPKLGVMNLASPKIVLTLSNASPRTWWKKEGNFIYILRELFI